MWGTIPRVAACGLTLGYYLCPLWGQESVNIFLPGKPVDPSRTHAAALAAGVHYPAAKTDVSTDPTHFAFDLLVTVAAVFDIKLAAIGDSLCVVSHTTPTLTYSAKD